MQLARNFGDGKFAFGVVNLVDSNGRETDGCGAFMAKEGRGGVSEVGVNELMWDDAVAEEGLAVCEVGVGEAGVAFGVRAAARGEVFAGFCFEFGGFCQRYCVRWVEDEMGRRRDETGWKR